MKALLRLLTLSYLKVLGIFFGFYILLQEGLMVFGVIDKREDIALLFLIFLPLMWFYHPAAKNMSWILNLPFSRERILKTTIIFNFVRTCSLGTVWLSTFLLIFGKKLFTEERFGNEPLEEILLSIWRTLDLGNINNSLYQTESLLAIGTFALSFFFVFFGGILSEIKTQNVRKIIIHSRINKWSIKSIRNLSLVIIGLVLFYHLYVKFQPQSLFAVIIHGCVYILAYHFLFARFDYERFNKVLKGKVILASMAVVYSLCLIYGSWRVHHPKISVENKISEYRFHGPLFHEIKVEEILPMLKRDIKPKSISHLMESLYDSSRGRWTHYHSKKYYNFYDFKNKLPIREFEDVITSKMSFDSLIVSLGLFDPTKIGPRELVIFQNHFSLLDKVNIRTKQESFLEESALGYLSQKSYSQDEVVWLLQSGFNLYERLGLANSYKRKGDPRDFPESVNHGLSLSDHFSGQVKYDIRDELYKERQRYDFHSLRLIGNYLTKFSCGEVELADSVRMFVYGRRMPASLKRCEKSPIEVLKPNDHSYRNFKILPST